MLGSLKINYGQTKCQHDNFYAARAAVNPCRNYDRFFYAGPDKFFSLHVVILDLLTLSSLHFSQRALKNNMDMDTNLIQDTNPRQRARRDEEKNFLIINFDPKKIASSKKHFTVDEWGGL